ncbi:MAG: Do family serine endopeptidase [Hyphomicrobiaceae bacterium]|nr:MAG: Do family serine endopeptidase [Hyphomicrobiaceae bacterium]
MDRSLPNHSAPRTGRRRLAYASALAGLALAGVVGLGLPQSSVHAQLKSDAPSIQTPMGRAPLSFADIVERVKPAVVSIHVTNGPKLAQGPKGAPPRGKGPDFFPELPDDHPLNEFFKRLPPEFRGQQSPNPRPSLAQGSGFVISADGYVVTNNHVIDGANKIQVSFDRDRKFEAELIGTDQRTDVALLKIKSKETFPFVKFSDKPPRVGDWVVAVGNPFGLGGTVTAGIVSALGRDIGSGPYDYMQIDAAVNRGNSGGPTFNLDGDVVGVNTAIYSPSGGNVGIAFAVPAKVASDVIAQLKAGGTVSRGWLGVKIQNIDEDTAASLGLGEAKGALVTEVTSPGPAAEAGLKNGDAILSVNGQKVADSRDLARQIASFAPNTKVDVRILRGQKEQTINVKLGTFPTGKEVARAEPAKEAPQTTEMDQLGLTVAPGSGAEKNGVVVTDVRGDSDAAQKGIKSGDVILEVGAVPVKSADDVANGIKEATKLGRKAVLLRIKSGDQMRFVAVQLKKS